MWGGLDEQKYDFDNLSDFKISMWSCDCKEKTAAQKEFECVTPVNAQNQIQYTGRRDI